MKAKCILTYVKTTTTKNSTTFLESIIQIGNKLFSVEYTADQSLETAKPDSVRPIEPKEVLLGADVVRAIGEIDPTATQIVARPESTLFTLNGKEYFLVAFGNTLLETFCPQDALDALAIAGCEPAEVRDTSIFDREEFDDHKGWIALYNCRDDMKGRVGFYLGGSTSTAKGLGLASSVDGLSFYPLTHGGAGLEKALCWRDAK